MTKLLSFTPNRKDNRTIPVVITIYKNLTIRIISNFTTNLNNCTSPRTCLHDLGNDLSVENVYIYRAPQWSIA